MSIDIDTLSKTLSEWTWSKMFAVLFLLTLSAIGFFLFEYYTSHFRLSRIQHASEVLASLKSLEDQGINKGSLLKKDYDLLKAQFSESIASPPIVATLSFQQPTFSLYTLGKFLMGGLLWFCISLTALHGDGMRKEKIKTFLAINAFTLFFGIIGVMLPDNPWLNFMVWPLFNVFFCYCSFLAVGAIFLGIMAIFGLKQKKKVSAKAES